MKRKVYLEGEIGHKFGKEFTMNVNSFGEAMRCLDANFKGFRQYLVECHEKDIMFECMISGNPIQDDRELLLLYPEGDMTITAVPAGSRKSAAGRMVLAAVLIYVSFQLGGLGKEAALAAKASGAGSTAGMSTSVAGIEMSVGTINALSNITLAMGVNLGMSALSEMMAPDPSTDNDQDESYLFQGSSQNIIEGDPVPVLYGKMRVPGRPISFHAKNENKAFADFGQVIASSEADTTTPGFVPPTEEQDTRDDEYYPTVPINPGL